MRHLPTLVTILTLLPNAIITSLVVWYGYELLRAARSGLVVTVSRPCEEFEEDQVLGQDKYIPITVHPQWQPSWLKLRDPLRLEVECRETSSPETTPQEIKHEISLKAPLKVEPIRVSVPDDNHEYRGTRRFAVRIDTGSESRYQVRNLPQTLQFLVRDADLPKLDLFAKTHVEVSGKIEKVPITARINGKVTVPLKLYIRTCDGDQALVAGSHYERLNVSITTTPGTNAYEATLILNPSYLNPSYLALQSHPYAGGTVPVQANLYDEDRLLATARIEIKVKYKIPDVYAIVEDMQWTVTRTSLDLPFKVKLSKPLQQPVSVKLETLDDTAKRGEHYEPLDTWLKFDPGETEKSVNIKLIFDPAHSVKAPCSFKVRLSYQAECYTEHSEATVTLHYPVLPTLIAQPYKITVSPLPWDDKTVDVLLRVTPPPTEAAWVRYKLVHTSKLNALVANLQTDGLISFSKDNYEQHLQFKVKGIEASEPSREFDIQFYDFSGLVSTTDKVTVKVDPAEKLHGNKVVVVPFTTTAQKYWDALTLELSKVATHLDVLGGDIWLVDAERNPLKLDQAKHPDALRAIPDADYNMAFQFAIDVVHRRLAPLAVNKQKLETHIVWLSERNPDYSDEVKQFDVPGNLKIRVIWVQNANFNKTSRRLEFWFKNENVRYHDLNDLGGLSDVISRTQDTD